MPHLSPSGGLATRPKLLASPPTVINNDRNLSREKFPGILFKKRFSKKTKPTYGSLHTTARRKRIRLITKLDKKKQNLTNLPPGTPKFPLT
jgi:hypothetical protein